MTEKQNRILHLLMAGILLVSMYMIAGRGAVYVNSRQVSDKMVLPEKEVCVVIDPGHGGADPGKVGINQALEMDVNLQIAKMLKTFLETEGINVVMTREDASGLYDENASCHLALGSGFPKCFRWNH